MPRARPLTPPLRFKFESRAMSTSSIIYGSTHTAMQTHIYDSIALYSMRSNFVAAKYHMVARFTICCLSYILHTILCCCIVLYFIHYHHHPWLLTTTRENSRLAKYQQYIINSNHKSMQLELLYDQTTSSFLDDFRKLVQSPDPEVQLAAVQDTSSPSSSQATASDTGSPSSSQATAPPSSKKCHDPARVKHSRSY